MASLPKAYSRKGYSQTLAHWSSQEWTLPCHGRDHRFKSGMGRLNYWCGTPTAERLVLEASVCGFESRLRHKHVISRKPKSNGLYLKAKSSKP